MGRYVVYMRQPSGRIWELDVEAFNAPEAQREAKLAHPAWPVVGVQHPLVENDSHVLDSADRVGVGVNDATDKETVT